MPGPLPHRFLLRVGCFFLNSRTNYFEGLVYVRVVLDHTFKHSYFPLAYLVKSADAGNMRTSVKVQSMVNSERGLVFRIWTIHGFMP